MVSGLRSLLMTLCALCWFLAPLPASATPSQPALPGCACGTDCACPAGADCCATGACGMEAPDQAMAVLIRELQGRMPAVPAALIWSLRPGPVRYLPVRVGMPQQGRASPPLPPPRLLA